MSYVFITRNHNAFPRTAGSLVLHRIWLVMELSSDAWAEHPRHKQQQLVQCQHKTMWTQKQVWNQYATKKPFIADNLPCMSYRY